jgi:V8-like Glu-specific endopeptidase
MLRQMIVFSILVLMLASLIDAKSGPIPNKPGPNTHKGKVHTRLPTVDDKHFEHLQGDSNNGSDPRARGINVGNGKRSLEGWSNTPTPVKKFTSARVISPHQNSNPYYKAVRILYTKAGTTSTYACSGVSIGTNLVLTAGHCVYSAAGFNTNYQIIPAYYQGTAPRGTWYAVYQWAHQSWVNNPTVPNNGDFAILETKNMVTGGLGLGASVGVAPVWSYSLTTQHVTVLGYPGNHDSGEILHRVDSMTVNPASGDAFPLATRYIGSDMGGGSSGGPWFLDFGIAAVGQTNAFNYKWNAVVGITSFGPVATTTYAYQGSSVIDSTTLNKISTWVYH